MQNLHFLLCLVMNKNPWIPSAFPWFLEDNLFWSLISFFFCYRTFFPKTATGVSLSDLVFRFDIQLATQTFTGIEFHYSILIWGYETNHERVFMYRVMDTDGGGSIGFMELMMAMEIVGSTKWDIFIKSLIFIFIRNTFDFRFNDEVSWAFRIFDIDNSGSIAVEEINDSVEVSDSMELRWIIIRELVKFRTYS